MIFRQLRIGGDRNFAYLIGDSVSGKAAIVDPGVNPEMILESARELDLQITHIINTHGHHDHVGANQDVKTATDALVYSANSQIADIVVSDGEVIQVGHLDLRVIATPGHTRDSICILAGNKLCTGDTLFVGKVGGTGFGQDARDEYHSLHETILKLPDETEVYPGHDYGVKPTSTVGNEKATNPFLIQPDFEAFIHLKKNWKAYKEKHGIK